MTAKSTETAAAPVETGESGPAPTPEAVVAFLQGNPQFFESHGHLLATMPAPGRYVEGGVVDLQKVMLDRRLEEISELRNCALEVIETSRSNMATQARTHAAVLALLAAQDTELLMRVIADDLPLLLDVDVVVLAFERGGRPLAELVNGTARYLYDNAVDQLVGVDRDVRLVRDMTDDGTIFGGAAGLVRSAALARIRPSRDTAPGLLALGSRGSAFHPGQGTELLAFLARVVEASVERCHKPRG